MIHKHFSVYDDEEFFEKYNQKRNNGNSPNELIEQPIIDSLIGEVEAKKVLDLGCGDGKYALNLFKRGMLQYKGIEGSTKMYNLAKKNLNDCNIELVNDNILNVELEKSEYDLIISRLVFHYLENIDILLIKIKESLKPEGEFVFSVEHPVITSCYDSYHAKGKREDWIVDNYFINGKRINEWMGQKVIKYHRTIEQYWNLFQGSGFKVVELKESKPIKSNFKNQDEFNRRNRIPLFLIFKLVK